MPLGLGIPALGHIPAISQSSDETQPYAQTTIEARCGLTTAMRAPDTLLVVALLSGVFQQFNKSSDVTRDLRAQPGHSRGTRLALVLEARARARRDRRVAACCAEAYLST